MKRGKRRNKVIAYGNNGSDLQGKVEKKYRGINPGDDYYIKKTRKGAKHKFFARFR